MNHLFDTTIAAGAMLLMASCVTRTEPASPTIEQLITPVSEPQVLVQPPNWPPHLHTGASDESPVFMLIQPLDRLILVDDTELTF